MSLGFSIVDLVSVLFFIASWAAYHYFSESPLHASRSLNSVMNRWRAGWMVEMSRREGRILDGNIAAALQNGSAFFATSTLFALGATLAMLRSSNEVLLVFADLPFAEQPTRAVWDIKVIGLSCILVYAFFKFSWAYRLFNYCAILIGATPDVTKASEAELDLAAKRAADMNIVAGRHFNRGQRAFFFALAYLGWFVSPWFFMAATGAALYAMWRRQFVSDALRSLMETPK